MRAKAKRNLTIIHFLFMGIALLSYFSWRMFGFRLVDELELMIRWFVVGSGIILFLFYMKPSRPISYYFTLYPLAAVCVLLGLVIRGFIGGYMVVLLTGPFMPEHVLHQQNEFIVRDAASGFMSRCCSYGITEKRFKAFAKDWGEFLVEGQIDLETINIQRLDEDRIQVAFLLEINENRDQTESETIIVLQP